MIRRYGKALRLTLMLVDGGLAAVLSLALYQISAHPDVPTADFIDSFWMRAVLYGVGWVTLLYINGGYRLRAHWTLSGEISAVARATVWLSLLGVSALYLAASDVPGSGWALLLFPIQGVLAVGLRVLVRLIFMQVRRWGHNVRFMLVLGTGPEALAFARTVQDHSVLGLRVVGFLGDEPPAALDAIHGAEYWGPMTELPSVLNEQVVDEVAVCVPHDEWHLAEELAQLAHDQGKIVRIPLSVPQMRSSERFLEDLEGTAVLSYANGPDEMTSHALKRFLDLAVAIPALIITAPFLAIVAVIMRLTQGPGIIYQQDRVGMHGRVFTIYKLRTMTHDADARYAELAEQSHTRGPAFKLVDDPRVTPAGRWLRRYSLDELPQLWNVLRGEMSIVGPRPAPPREVEDYDLWHRRRLSMKPGITGLWQITSRLDEDFDQRAQLDMAYIEGWSLWLDVAIIFRTIPALLRRPGV
jgi:exopolysaccharide biosynthesis polyprenyl glycosylphosphotransferase